ncbi:MAG: heavy metal translocating P-type ATPase [Limisphaerales bacterium]
MSASCCPDEPKSKDHHDEDGHDHSGGVARRQVVLVAVSGAAIAIGFLLLWTKMSPGWLSQVAFAIGTLTGGALVLPGALASVRRFRLDMNVLMTVAVAGAWAIGEEAEGAAVVFLFAFAELLETWSVSRANRAVASLLELTPATALRLKDDGSTEETAAAEVLVGDRILVRSGARLPLDGEVVAGESSVNQAPITGESVPVEKALGATVFAGTINGEGSLTVRVTKPAGDSTLARIIRLVQEAGESKAPTQRFVDRFAGIYTPVVFLLAVLTALVPPLLFDGAWSEWIYRALALLVIACPCALVIATPVSIVSGLTALARRGVLVKGGEHLENIGRLRALAVDKTGTITEGRPGVREILRRGTLSEADILARAAAIDAHSEHPLARCIVAEAKAQGLTWPEATGYQARIGRGALATIAGHLHFVGNHRLAHELGLCTPELESVLAGAEARGLTLVVLGHAPHDGCPGEVLGIIAASDTIRPEAKEALASFKALGISPVVMLSGDNQRTVDAVARAAGLTEARGDLLPEDKVTEIRRLLAAHSYVGMVGDGVNDAPALALATVGIAMGAAGSDTAIETADLALMKDDLRKLAEAITVGRRSLRIIRFNVGFAVLVKAVFLILAFTGHTSLWLAIFADTGATLLVIANALRLLRQPASA